MTPAARVQSAIDILDAVIEAAARGGAPADRIVAQWAKDNRYAGSKDRRAIRELVYAAIRACGPRPDSGRAAMLRLAEVDDTIQPLFDGSAHAPSPIGANEQPAKGGVATSWLVGALDKTGLTTAEQFALLDRAPLDIRINTLRADAGNIDLPETGEETVAPLARRYPAGTRVEDWPAYREGRIEVQDAGSQLICAALDAQPGETVMDLCAGAGGKTLALAAAMQNRGILIAADTDRGRLSRLAPRAERAGAMIGETLLLDPGQELEKLGDYEGAADAVLIDAPCSGTGTWRRNPEARWRITRAEVDRLAALQARLLDLGAALVKPGGRIVYAVCSLLEDEGRGQVDTFLARHPDFAAQELPFEPDWRHGAGILLHPSRSDTDGFFFAALQRSC